MVLAMVNQTPALAANPGMPELLRQVREVLAGRAAEEPAEPEPTPEPEPEPIPEPAAEEEPPSDGTLPGPNNDPAPNPAGGPAWPLPFPAHPRSPRPQPETGRACWRERGCPTW